MRFTLAILPNGKAILTTTEHLTQEHMADIGALWEKWKKSNRDLLVVGECEVRLIADIDLEMPDGPEERQGPSPVGD